MNCWFLGFDYKETVHKPWTTIIEPLEEIASRLSYAWKVTSHLNGVRNSPELRIAFEKVGQIKIINGVNEGILC